MFGAGALIALVFLRVINHRNDHSAALEKALSDLNQAQSNISSLKRKIAGFKHERVINLPSTATVAYKPFFVSYAQDYEDFILYNLFENVTAGFYIDVGANDPVLFSVTKLFYDMGWHGINIEPLEYHFKSLQADRPRDINLCLAIGDKPGNLTLYERNRRTTLNEETAKRWKKYTPRTHIVKVVTLAAMCDEYCASEPKIDFLKVDVENSEGSVLAGADFKKYRPRVVVIEAWDATPSWDSVFQENNYQYMGQFFRNRYYIDNAEPELIQKFKTYDELLEKYILFRKF